MEQDLTSLVTRLQKGDRDAFQAIYSLTAPKLFGVALHLVGNAAIARQTVKFVYSSLWINKGLPHKAESLSFLDGLIAFTKRKALALAHLLPDGEDRKRGDLTGDPQIRAKLREQCSGSRVSAEDWELIASLHIDRRPASSLSERYDQSPELIKARIENLVRTQLGRNPS